MNKKSMFKSTNKQFFSNVSSLMLQASRGLYEKNRVLAKACQELSQEFKDLDKNYKIVKK